MKLPRVRPLRRIAFCSMTVQPESSMQDMPGMSHDRAQHPLDHPMSMESHSLIELLQNHTIAGTDESAADMLPVACMEC